MSGKLPHRWTADAMMIGTVMLRGSSYPFAKDVLAVMSPLLYSASRYLVASLFLFAMMALMRRPMALPQPDWVPMILLAVGSDYNLLLVSRFKEELHHGLNTGIIRAMAGTGSVVTSAGLVPRSDGTRTVSAVPAATTVPALPAAPARSTTPPAAEAPAGLPVIDYWTAPHGFPADPTPLSSARIQPSNVNAAPCRTVSGTPA